MDTTEQHHSRVPPHLRPFHHPAYPTPQSAKSKPSSEVQSQISTSPELCPPHWRIQRKRSLKSTLKSIITKDWQSLLEESPQPIKPILRPQMRMKDSDDYITARAANPRTGLISPSVGTRTPCTPDSPGDALKLRANEHVSPTPYARTRPSLSRANEGRNISGGSTRTKRTDINGTQWNSPPKIPGQEVEQDHVSRASPILSGDTFVVHMPSAREPQPFAYPGYTAEQIAALEHYQRKTRRVSSEGYDRRLLSNSGIPSSALSAAECGNTPTDENGPAIYTCPTGQHFNAYRYHHPHHHHTHEPSQEDEPPRITVRKRKTQVDKIRQEIHEAPRVDGEAEVKKSFKIPTNNSAIDSHSDIKRPRQHPHNEEIPRTVPTEACPHSYLSSSPKHAQIRSATGEISRKQIFGSAPSCTAVANHAATAGDRYHADGLQKTPSQPVETAFVSDAVPAKELDLCSQLPRVRLVRPELAGVPRELRENSGRRECSFGCRREGGNGERSERRKPSSSSTVVVSSRQASTSFVDHPPEREGAASNDSARIPFILSTVACLLVDYARSVQAQIPRWIAVVVEMLSPREGDTPATKEKLEALKALVSLIGHALAVCIALATVWKLAVAVLNLIEVILWPLAVPLRIMRFMIGLG